jgi:hypothetical protein
MNPDLYAATRHGRLLKLLSFLVVRRAAGARGLLPNH